MKKLALSLFNILLSAFAFTQTVADFENLNLPADTFWNGADLSGGFASGAAFFANNYDTTYLSWSGFSYSSKTDTLTQGFGNQYSAITGSGASGSATYAVADEYGNAKIALTGTAQGKTIRGVYITNSVYAYWSMHDGDLFAKKFGGASGDDADWFKLTVKGWLGGTIKANEVEFYLADYRFADNAEDYILKDWTWLNLQPLGNVDSIQFFLSSSDTGTYGMNTPAYFCLDNFTTNDQINNVAPIAADDEFTITYLQDTALNVLANDLDTTLTPLHVTLTSVPLVAGASAVVESNNHIRYTPAIGIVTTDTLSYSVCDDAGLCASAKVIIHITGISNVPELAAEQWAVYPNPFRGELQVKLPPHAQEIQVIDAAGRIWIKETTDGSANMQLATHELPSGFYLIRVIANNQNYSSKLIKGR